MADETREAHRSLPSRPTGESHFPLIDALWNDVEVMLQVNVPNRGALEGVPDDVVVELPAACSKLGVRPLQVGRLPEVLMRTQLYPRLQQAEQVVPDARTGRTGAAAPAPGRPPHPILGSGGGVPPRVAGAAGVRGGGGRDDRA